MTRFHTILLATLALAACGPSSGGGELSSVVTDAECLGSAYRSDAPLVDTGDTGGPVEDPAIAVSVSGTTVIVEILDVSANCCPSPGSTVTLDGSDIAVDFVSVTDDSELCLCDCISNFTVEIEDVPSGTYALSVVYDGAAIGSVPVIVD